MFDKEIAFTGKHAEYITAMVQKNKEDKNEKVKPAFKSAIDLVVVASILGFIKKRKGNVDKSDDSRTTKIFTDQLLRYQDQLEMNYRLIMLLDQKDSLSSEERIDKAFRYDRNFDKRKPGDEVFMAYTLGGIEVLYEELMGNVADTTELIQNMSLMVDSFNEEYDFEGLGENIFKLCSEAGE